MAMLPEPLQVTPAGATPPSPTASDTFSPPAAFGALSSNPGSVSGFGSGSSDAARRRTREATAFPTEEEGPLSSSMLSLSLPEVRDFFLFFFSWGCWRRKRWRWRSFSSGRSSVRCLLFLWWCGACWRRLCLFFFFFLGFCLGVHRCRLFAFEILGVPVSFVDVCPYLFPRFPVFCCMCTLKKSNDVYTGL